MTAIPGDSVFFLPLCPSRPSRNSYFLLSFLPTGTLPFFLFVPVSSFTLSSPLLLPRPRPLFPASQLGSLLTPLTDHPAISRFHLVIWKCLLAKSLLQIHGALAQNAWKINSMYILGNLAPSCIFPLETVSKATERNHSQMRQSLSEKTCVEH